MSTTRAQLAPDAAASARPDGSARGVKKHTLSTNCSKKPSTIFPSCFCICNLAKGVEILSCTHRALECSGLGAPNQAITAPSWPPVSARSRGEVLQGLGHPGGADARLAGQAAARRWGFGFRGFLLRARDVPQIVCKALESIH